MTSKLSIRKITPLNNIIKSEKTSRKKVENKYAKKVINRKRVVDLTKHSTIIAGELLGKTYLMLEAVLLQVD